MAPTLNTLKRFFRTPKGMLIALMAVVTAVAAASEGVRLIAPGLAGGVLAAMLVDAPMLRWRDGEWIFPDGALLTGLIVATILTPHEAWWIAAVTSAIAIASKYLFRVGKANVFNPAALALVITFYMFDTGHSWWGSLPEAPPLALVLLVATGIFITDRVKKTPLVLSFLGTYYLLVTATAFLGQPGRVAELYRVPDLNAALYFAFFMVTDPPTSPPKQRDQLINGVVVAVVSYAAFEFIGAAYFLLAGLLAGNVWEAIRRWRMRKPARNGDAAGTIQIVDEYASWMNCRAGPVLQIKQRSRRQLATARALITLAVTGVLGTLGACASLGPSSRSREAHVIYRVASATDIDTIRGFATLPVHQGLVGKQVVWYIVTESSDRADAARRGVTWSPRLKAVAGTAASQRAHESRGMLNFDAGVDVSPNRLLTANSDSGFPPASAAPGSLADPFYSPFVVLDNGIVLNAPIIADEYAALDRVDRLDPTSGTVRLRISRGYVNDQTVWYTSTEASDPGVAAMERATFAPAIRAAPGEGVAAGVGSARTGILAVINGETGADNPERQGLRSALLDDRAPLNVLEHAPDPTGRNPIYSPAWELTLVRWSVAAVEKNQRTKIFSWTQASALLASGFLVAEAPVRVVINCPVIVVYSRRP